MSYRTSRSFEVQNGCYYWPADLLELRAQLTKELAIQNFDLENKVEELEAQAFSLSAGVCEFRSGNEHGNAMCLATGDLIERMKPKRQQHAMNCAGRVGGDCTCDFKSTFGK